MKRNLFLSTVGVLSGRLTMPLFSFILFYVTARKLTVGEFGLYVLLTGLITLFQGIAGLGLGPLLSREIGKQPADEGVAVGSAVAITLPASAAAYALFLALAYLLKGDGDFLRLAAIIGLSLPLSSLVSVAESVFMARGAGSNLLYLGLVEQIARVALSIFALFQGYGLYGLTAAYVASRVLGVLYSARLYARAEARPPLRLDSGHIRQTCSYLKSFAPIMIVGLILYRADVLTLGWFLTDEEMGLYGCAIRIANLSFIGPDSVVAAALPDVSRRWTQGEPSFGKSMVASTEFLLAASLAGVVLMAAFAPVAVPLVFGAKFAGAAPLLAVVAFMLPSHALEIQAANLFQAIGRERTALFLMLVSLPVFFGLLSLGAAAGGMLGASFGFVAASWIMGIVGLRKLPETALDRPASARLVWAIRLTAAALFLLALWRPESAALHCLLLAAAALTALCGSGIFDTLDIRRVRSILS
ncbi:MAG: oligosaccharide flippase family protein [Planctomycetota bacterium]|jgi:O-antigen/teichoic acid export membrane protein|nr:oligosaccharide flippase family protein [Planctomycetota bacterium]